MMETQVDEQRPRISVGLSFVHRPQRVIEAAEQQVVDRGEEQHRVVPARGCLGHEAQDLVALGDRTADSVVER
jgi:hypothetical protein